MTIIYTYNKTTGELISSSIAKENPLEKGSYLLPAYATTVAMELDDKDNYAQIFNTTDEDWEYKEDYRGQEYVTELSPLGDTTKITELGTLDDSCILTSLLSTDDDGEFYGYYLSEIDDDTGLYEADTDTITSVENQATYKATYTQAIEDLLSADTQITYHNESSSRAVATIYDWYAYKEALRDIASLDDGTYSITDISDNTYSYTVDDVETDYTCSLDDDGYPIEPS